MAKTSSAAVSKALLGNFSDIVTAISAADPLKVAIELVSVSLTSQETLSKMLTVPATPLEKSTTLVMSVLDHVKIVPGKLETFMGTLHKSIDESSFKSELISEIKYTIYLPSWITGLQLWIYWVCECMHAPSVRNYRSIPDPASMAYSARECLVSA